MTHKTLRCAIYTRKSTEEGLEKEFNSLEAQREAGEAYIKSQQHEGWRLITKSYDDGGYSGGTIERPALQELLNDIRSGKIDVVVVYKVDRLSRSLRDFAQIVELFEKQNVSFVSVTQQFNTTTSMGRLTLNILLSFAQFEREVIGERVRDKFAASKQKGMWMGGFPPLGYDIKERKLYINPEEASLVRKIFENYLNIKSCLKLAESLNNTGYRNKKWVNQKEIERGGEIFTNQALSKILNNPIYIGKIKHKKKIYDGQHDAIITEQLWQQVQELLASQRKYKTNKRIKHGTLLAGKCFNQAGEVYTPTYSTKAGVRQYRYYMHKASKHRINAIELETLVFDMIRYSASKENLWKNCWSNCKVSPDEAYTRWKQLCNSWENIEPVDRKEIIQEVVSVITIGAEKLMICLSNTGIGKIVEKNDLKLTEVKENNELREIDIEPEIISIEDHLEISLPVVFANKGRNKVALDGNNKPVRVFRKTKYDQVLINALAKSYRWNHMLNNGEITITELANQHKVSRTYISRFVNLMFLAPEIVESILNGKQSIKLKNLMNSFPVDWKDQYRLLNL